MKWLTGIKLINWHYFVNETLRFRGSALLTGDNGSGKSTIFDAIQFALIADQRKVRFNISAHDETNRDLKGYLRCKTGQDDPQGGDGEGYLRSGDFTSYIALEFRDTVRGDDLLLGTAVDTFAGEPDSPQFFRCAGALDDSLFLRENRPFSVSEFRAALKARKGGEIFPTAAAYRTALKAQLGHLNDRFFTLIIKALAFHPITDIRKFVYDYVLDEHEVKIDAMLENLRQYRHYEILVTQTKEKLARLAAISEKHRNRSDQEQTAAIQQYVILRAGREATQEELDLLRSKEAEARRRQAAAEAALGRLATEHDRLTGELRDLQDARARNDAYLALQALNRDLAELSCKAGELRQEGTRLMREAGAEAGAMQAALTLAGRQGEALGLAVDETEADLALLAGGLTALAPAVKGDWDAAPADLSAITPALERLRERALLREDGLKKEEAALRAERRELEEALADLRRHRIRYPKAVEALRTAIREGMTGVEPRPLCELIDIPDERWQNAAEGYLNTQRFDLFVPYGAFEGALSLYERRKLELGIESVGLVNGEQLVKSEPSAVPGSLADEVVTGDPVARAYVDRLLGRVMKCANEQELRRYSVAITPTCMTYRNHTARQIEFHVYQVPYIGSRAISRQIEMKERQLQEVAARLEQVVSDLKLFGQFLTLVRGRELNLLQERWERVARLPELQQQITYKEEAIRQIDVAELNSLQRQIEQKEAALKAILRDRDTQNQASGSARKDLDHLAREIREMEARWQSEHALLEQYCRERPDVGEAGAARYMEASRRNPNRVLVQNYANNRNGLLTQIAKLTQELQLLRMEYNQRYQFGGAPDAHDNDAYERDYVKLQESELPSYEEKIEQAKQDAEQEFKEHFIFKLSENIRLARQEFDNLNRALKEIPFGQDRYQFTCAADRTRKPFYDMIMDDFAVEGFHLFSLHFREKYGETLDELFRLILDVPEEKQAENIRRYTDYRTYLEFDIRIHHGSGETSTFSKVAREKSGGETQTPFYVAMIASFLQLYRPRQNAHTIRLMMFDEAFNRMDPDRAENMLQFIRKLGLQVLAAAPTDKCEIITPHVETTLLVMRDGHRAWLEDYHQVLAAESIQAEAAVTSEQTL